MPIAKLTHRKPRGSFSTKFLTKFIIMTQFLCSLRLFFVVCRRVGVCLYECAETFDNLWVEFYYI